MLFNSFSFLVFFAIVLLLHRLPLPWTVKKFNLVAASYLFYAAWNPPFVLLLWISTVVDWVVGRRLHDAEDTRVRRRLLMVSLAVNLGLLGFFKYASFALENFVWLVQQMGFDFHPAAPGIILPLGISFYTFQTLSYTISIYRRDLRPADSLVDFALFVTFFPQLVAGPIVRAKDFIFQLASPVQADVRQFGWGLALMNFGIFEKVVLSDTLLAPVADEVLLRPRRRGHSMPGSAPSRLPARSSSTSVATPPVPSARRSASGSSCPRISAVPMPRSASRISGDAGTFHFRPGCVTTSTSPWAEIVGAVPEPTSTWAQRCCWEACGTGRRGTSFCGADCTVSF